MNEACPFILKINGDCCHHYQMRTLVEHLQVNCKKCLMLNGQANTPNIEINEFVLQLFSNVSTVKIFLCHTSQYLS